MRSVLLAFALLLLVSPLNAAEPTKPEAPAPAAATAAAPVAQVLVTPSIQPNDATACRPNQPSQPNQPAVVEPPKFDMVGAGASAEPEVPVGVSVALGVIAAIVGGGAGVAVQWKATHRAV
jgi:hypothetical protein